MATFEISSRNYKTGRRKFVATLYELQPPECVVDDVGTKYNKNGITFLEKYAEKQLDSIKDMSVRVAFIDDERTMISDHGKTGIINDMPVFENATAVGHFTKGWIDDIEIDGEKKRCVFGEGYLDEMCYPDFVSSLEENLNNGVSIDGSIEIYKPKDSAGIVYKKGWIEKGRIPVNYIHSGWDIVLFAADASSRLYELNNMNKEEKKNMEFDKKEFEEVLKSTLAEINGEKKSHDEEVSELNNKITELNSQIEAKDADIATRDKQIEELNAKVEQLEKDMKKKDDEKDDLEKEVTKAKASEKLSEVESALKDFSDEEKEIAIEDIKKLKDEINACKKKSELNNVTSEINSIKSKICMNIVAKQKQAESESRISEQNSEEVKVEDIFSEVCSEKYVDDYEEVNIF